MKRARVAWAMAATAALLVALSGCAVTDEQAGAGGGAYEQKPQDPARIGLPIAYRAFYDELQDEGDWVLIEPYGWCFRPRVNFTAWRPYQDGWWEPSDFYGWIWNSNEPFGWITYHYGSWFYDEYQGWVWQPGPTWGPAWVAWVQADQYLGWAALPPASYDDFDHVPDGVFTYAPAQQFVSQNVGQSSMFVAHLPGSVRGFREILSIGHVNGVAFNRGPDMLAIQRAAGSLPQRTDPSTLPRVKLAGVAPRMTDAEIEERSSRIVSAGRAQLRRMVEAGVTPPPSGTGHLAPSPPPVSAPPRFKPRQKPSPEPAPADTVRTPPSREPRAPRTPRDSTAVPDTLPDRHVKRPPHEPRHPRNPALEPDTTRTG